jgi:hypothetical protein
MGNVTPITPAGSAAQTSLPAPPGQSPDSDQPEPGAPWIGLLTASVVTATTAATAAHLPSIAAAAVMIAGLTLGVVGAVVLYLVTWWSIDRSGRTEERRAKITDELLRSVVADVAQNGTRDEKSVYLERLGAFRPTEEAAGKALSMDGHTPPRPSATARRDVVAPHEGGSHCHPVGAVPVIGSSSPTAYHDPSRPR